MREALTDFIKNAGLFTVLHFFIIIFVLLLGLAMTMLVRKRAGQIWFLMIGLIPAISGILAWYLENDIANHRLGMLGRLNDAAVADLRREALIDLIFGLLVAAVVLGLRMWRTHNNRRAIIK
ncbi:MAG TPA: hypothetical protein VE863_09080 [Pyrinomonadaceae bacterium]|jgi:hypothetical protein|nr:hypothetical protein [Pyrinomonadaceae bacterium]